MYPLFIDIKNKKVLVVGAGKTALKRIKSLYSEGADITVVSPEDKSDKFDEYTNLKYIKSEYNSDFINGQFLVMAATNDNLLNEQIVKNAESKNILVSSVTKSENDCVIPSYDEMEGIKFAVTTNGISPSLSAGLCRQIKNEFSEYKGLCSIQQDIRKNIIASVSEPAVKCRIMREISSPAMLALYKSSGKDAYIRQAEKIKNRDFSSESGKKAILVISFGTSYEDTREKTIGAVEKSIQDSFPEYDVFRAFTSEVIIKKLYRNGIETDTVSEALSRLYRYGYTEVYCQPTHIITGEEYDGLCNNIKFFENVFDVLKTGKPLIAETDDYTSLIEALEECIIKKSDDTAYIFMGHGTFHSANSVYPALNFDFRRHGFDNVFTGTVEGYPSLENVISFLENAEFKNIELYPLLLVAGDHVQNDMAGDDSNSWKSVLVSLGYNVSVHITGLGEYEAVRRLYINHIKSIL